MVSCRQITTGAGIAILAFVLKTVYDTGAFKNLIAHGEDRCRRVSGPVGMEDLALYTHPKDGRVLAFSGSDAREKWFGIGYFHPTSQSQRIEAIPAAEQGGIYVFDTSAAAAIHKVDVLGYSHPDFHPHGLSSRKLASGEWMLFAVNHRRDGDTIDIFEITAAASSPAGVALTYRSSVAHPLIRHANDVVIADPRAASLYVTNWYYYEKGTVWSMLEAYLQRPYGTVVYCKDVQSKTPTCWNALEGLKMANGVAMTADDSTLYVGTSIERNLIVATPIPTTAAVGTPAAVREVLFMNTAIDNVVVMPYPPATATVANAASHAVYLAAHPKMLSFVAHEHDRSRPAPAQVIRVVPNRAGAGAGGKESFQVDELFLTLGERFNFSASATGVVVGGKLLVSAVFSSGLLVCDGY